MRKLWTLCKKTIQGLSSKGFVHVMVGNTLVKALGFLSSMLVARLLSKPDMGTFSYTDNILSYFTLLSGMGVSSAILRYCAIAKDVPEKLAYFSFSTKAGTLFQVLLSAIIVILSQVVSFPFPFTSELLLFLALYPIFQFLYEHALSFLRSEMRFRQYSVFSVLFAALMVASLVGLTARFGLFGIPMARYATVLLCLAGAILCVRRVIRTQYQGALRRLSLDKGQKKEFLLFSLTQAIAGTLSTMMILNESFLINNLLQNEVVTAEFKIATTIPYSLLFITGSVVIFLFPYFSKRHAEHAWVWKTALRSSAALSAVYLLMTVAYALFARPIISTVFGAQYAEAAGISALIFFSCAINAGLRTLPLNVTAALGQARFNLRMAIFAVLSQLALDTVLIRWLGVHGAVFGIMLVYIVTTPLYWRKLYRMTHPKQEE